jgi:hypothetical protein
MCFGRRTPATLAGSWAAARRLYKNAGFTLTAKKTDDSFGRKGLVAETWDLTL